MTESERQIRQIVQDELLGLIGDGQELLGLKKDPTGMGRKALEALADMIRRRRQEQGDEAAPDRGAPSADL